MPQKILLEAGGCKCDDEARYDIISVRAEGADMPTGKTRSRCAWEAVNLSVVHNSGDSCHKSHVLKAPEEWRDGLGIAMWPAW